MSSVKIQHPESGNVGEVPARSVAFWEARGYKRLDAESAEATEQTAVAETAPSTPIGGTPVNVPGGDQQGIQNGTAAGSADEKNIPPTGDPARRTRP